MFGCNERKRENNKENLHCKRMKERKKERKNTGS